MCGRFIISLLAALIGCTKILPAAQVTLTPVADTSLWQGATNHNLGGSDLLPVGAAGDNTGGAQSRLLIKFDVAMALPTNAVIESATLTLQVVHGPGPSTAHTANFDGYKILNDWGEGNKSYTNSLSPMTSTQVATAGEATWTHRFFGDDNARWIEPGGAIYDQDFSETADFSFFTHIDSQYTYVIPLNSSGIKSVQDWLADPANNFGWVIRIADQNPAWWTARQVASREYADPAERPQLTINYSTSQPDPPQIESIVRAGSQLTIRFGAQANVIYRPQFRPFVDTAAWTDLPDLGPLGAAGNLEFSDDLTGIATRFYRVIVP